MKPIVLHSYQQDVKTRIYNSWNAGNRNVLGVTPTGGGKSVIMSDIVNDFYRAGRRGSVTAHRNELVTQMSTHIAARGIPHRIIGAASTVSEAIASHREKFGQSFVNPSAPITVAGVDTLISRKDDLKDWAVQQNFWIQDEAHHGIGNDRVEPNKWGKAVQMFPNAQGLGFTATPQRADGQGLGIAYDGFYHDMVIGPTTRWLIENNFLCDYEIVCPKSDIVENIESEKLSADGDWSNHALKKASKKSKIVGDVVTNYLRYAKGRKAIVFATDVETAGEMAERFNEAGIRSVSLSGKSHSTYRRQSLKQFAAGEIQVLVNVDLFDEGFDLPSCDVCIMARPTASLAKYLQMVGRVLRYLIGKIALIIDHVSNVIRHGLPDKVRKWSLARKDKRAKQIKDPNEIELTTCSSCLKPHEKFYTVCPHCAFEKPLPEPRSRSIEMVEGDLILLDRETLEKMRQATQLESPGSIANRVSQAAGSFAGRGAANRQTEKMAAHNSLSEAIAQWAAIERQMGYDDRQIAKRFYLTTGIDVLSALDGKRDRKEFEELAQTVRGWYSQ